MILQIFLSILGLISTTVEDIVNQFFKQIKVFSAFLLLLMFILFFNGLILPIKLTNTELFFLGVMVCGAMLNIFVLAVNKGRFPAKMSEGEHYDSRLYQPLSDKTRFNELADVMVIKNRFAFSIGDVLAVVGALVFNILLLMRLI